jgi:hypothetical protein
MRVSAVTATRTTSPLRPDTVRDEASTAVIVPSSGLTGGAGAAPVVDVHVNRLATVRTKSNLTPCRIM